MLSREDVIGIVAKEHGILISKDDPILALLAVHQVLMDEYAATIGSEVEAANQSFIQALRDAQETYSEQSKALANQVVGNAVKNVTAAEKRLVTSLEQFQVEKLAVESKLNRLELWMICCAVLSLGAIIIGVIK